MIDITHGIARHDVRGGRWRSRRRSRTRPVGVHLAVVDPEVGGQRRGVALSSADGRRFVGPDNGLLVAAAERCGGVVEAVEISGSAFRLEPVSATFHGRDVFAPVAAHLAAGRARQAGVPTTRRRWSTLDLPQARTEAGVLVAHAVYVDRFGNVGLDFPQGRVGGRGRALGHVVRRDVRRWRSTPARLPTSPPVSYSSTRTRSSDWRSPSGLGRRAAGLGGRRRAPGGTGVVRPCWVVPACTTG